MARKKRRRMLNVVEFEVLPEGPIQILGHSQIVMKGKFDPAWYKLPRPTGEDGGRRRFFLTLEMVEEHWLIEGRGRNRTSQLVSSKPLYRSFWLELGDPWLQRIESAWRLFENVDSAEAHDALDRLQEGWNLVHVMIVAEAYRFWWLKGLSAKRPSDRELDGRMAALEQRAPDHELQPDDVACSDRMLKDLHEQVQSALGFVA